MPWRFWSTFEDWRYNKLITTSLLIILDVPINVPISLHPIYWSEKIPVAAVLAACAVLYL
jgi:hypothetical protein